MKETRKNLRRAKLKIVNTIASSLAHAFKGDVLMKVTANKIEDDGDDLNTHLGVLDIVSELLKAE